MTKQIIPTEKYPLSNEKFIGFNFHRAAANAEEEQSNRNLFF